MKEKERLSSRNENEKIGPAVHDLHLLAILSSAVTLLLLNRKAYYLLDHLCNLQCNNSLGHQDNHILDQPGSHIFRPLARHHPSTYYFGLYL
jgi:hypothetical protein